MTHEDDPEAFLEIFECATVAAELDKTKWASQLGVLLVGKAQVAYQSMFRIEAQAYDTLKEEILYHSDMTPERY